MAVVIICRRSVGFLCFSAVFFALLLVSSPILPAMSMPGGLQEIPTAHNDLEVQDLAKFAIDQHNSRQNSNLEFAGIISAHKQVVAGLMFHFTLKAVSGGRVDVYEAKVWVKPWENFKSLEHFKLVENSLTSADLGTHLDGPVRLGLQPVSCADPAVKEAAKEALKSVQDRSNSLIPYELKEVVSAHAEVNDESTRFSLLFKVQRGSKEEQFKAEILRTVVGEWTIKDLQQHHEDGII
eukprot:c11898_g1_i1 orf=102-815(+)